MLKILGYVFLGAALVSLGATLFGDAGIWGFLAFLLAAFFGTVFWLLGLAASRAGRLRELLLPATAEAKLRRRLILAALKGPVRAEAGEVSDKLRRLEHVWPAVQRHLGERLDASELTFQRYDGVARQAWQRALQELEDAASLVESLAVVRGGVRGKADGTGDEASRERVRQLGRVLEECEQALSALERLDFALVTDLHTGSAARTQDLDLLVAELDRLSSRAGRYAAGG